mgnify:CR=1 FL=1
MLGIRRNGLLPRMERINAREVGLLRGGEAGEVPEGLGPMYQESNNGSIQYPVGMTAGTNANTDNSSTTTVTVENVTIEVQSSDPQGVAEEVEGALIGMSGAAVYNSMAYPSGRAVEAVS